MATFYIATTGYDTTGSGSSGTPWLTLTKAITGSSSGDTIRAAAGTYTWGLNTDVSNRTIIGNSPTDTIFSAAGIYAFWKGNGTINISNIKFYNMDIATNPSNWGNSNCQVNFAAKDSSASNWTLYNCIFDTLLTTGSYTSLGGIFADNTMTIGGYGTGYSNSTFLINSCLFNKVRRSASGGSGSCIFSANCTVNNCTFYFDESTYPLAGIAEDTYVGTNNIFSNIGTSFPFGTATQTYSCVNGISSPPAGTGNTTSNPLLVSPTSLNFELQVSSPCLDTGTLI